MSVKNLIASSASVTNTLNAGTDPISDLRSRLDLARNQFRARQFAECSALVKGLVIAADGLVSSSSLSEQDSAHLNVLSACALTLNGRCAEETGRPEQAKLLWARAVEVFDANLSKITPPPDTLGYYGAALRMVGRRSDAISTFKRVIESGTAAPETYRHLGLALKDEGQFAESVAQLRKALEISPSDLRSKRGLAEALAACGDRIAAARSFIELAQALASAQDTEAALQAVRESLSLNASDPEAFRYQGDLLALLNLNEQALESFDRSLALKSDDPATHLSKAAVLFHLRRDEQALDAINRSLVLNPKLSAALVMKGLILSQSARNEEAESAFREAIQVNPASWIALAELSHFLFLLDRPGEAIVFADLAQSLQPGEPFLLSVRGLVLAHLDRLDEALESFNQALKADPDHALAWAGKGEVLAFRSHPTEALEAFDLALKLDPDNAWSLARKGDILCDMGEERQPEGIALIQKSLDMRPNAVEAARLAFRLISARRIEEAGTAADLALRLDSANAQGLFAKAEVLRRLADTDDDRTAALDLVEQGLRRNPDSADALRTKGQLLHALNRNDEAEVCLRASARVSPDTPSVWRSLAELLIDLERYPDALAALDQYLELDPKSAYGLGIKAETLVKLNKPAEAINCFRESAALGDLPWVHRELADLLQERGDNENALEHIDLALRGDPKSASAHALRGYVLRSMGRNEDAESALIEAVKQDDTLYWAYAELASVCRDLDKPAEALLAVNHSLELSPDYASALDIKGQILVTIAEGEQAIAFLDRAIQLQAAWATHFWRGLALESRDRVEEAAAAYRTALSFESDDVWSLRGLADMLLLLGSEEEGKDLFERILEKMNGEERGPYGLGLCGWCHFGCKRLDPAIRLYSEALLLDRDGRLKAGQFDLALIIACNGRYGLARREYERAMELAQRAHPWAQKGLFGTAIVDLKRAMQIRYKQIASEPAVLEFLEKLQGEYARASEPSNRPTTEQLDPINFDTVSVDTAKEVDPSVAGPAG